MSCWCRGKHSSRDEDVRGPFKAVAHCRQSNFDKCAKCSLSLKDPSLIMSPIKTVNG